MFFMETQGVSVPTAPVHPITKRGKEECRLFPPLVTHDDIFGPSSLSYSVVQQFGRLHGMFQQKCPPNLPAQRNPVTNSLATLVKQP
ncbi:hypothetical protein RRG08_013955 [Elysia crispata]|uniref:Uncharacterized protein n=1 Tax=Elysia crispata TaxID=231223 RepID=A0AAE0ZZ58_9GAST|nr:hypothetical protein RRG08_013955 [Elysia crispata]